MNHGLAFFVLAVIVAATSSPSSAAQGVDGVGQWSPTYEWIDQISVKDSQGSQACFNAGRSTEAEFSSAAMIPTGYFEGAVILWRRERAINTPCYPNCGTIGEPNCVPIDTNVTWVFYPSIPTKLVSMEQTLDSDIFCAGASWDRHGNLLVVGGVPTGLGEECEFPVETYRLRPENMTGIIWNELTNYPSVLYGSRLPWKAMGSMAIERYYPTVIPLSNAVTYTSQGHGSVVMAAGSNMTAGGPYCGESNDGNEFWEIIEAKKSSYTDWYDPIIPVNPDENDHNYPGNNAPHYGLLTGAVNPDYYVRPAPPANRLFDSYPRMYQVSDDDRSIVVIGDVDTGEPPPNAAGSTWVIKPRNDTGGGSQTNWELHTGPQGLDPDGPTGPDVWHDSHYDTAVVMSEISDTGLRLPDRILMMGGSRDPGAPTGWIVNDEVWEFAYTATGDPLSGTWLEKPAPSGDGLTGDEFDRLYGMAVLLPTGEIFFEGGSRTDDWVAHNGYVSGPCDPLTNPMRNASDPNDVPIIFDPGVGQLDGGVVYRQPENEEVNNENSARLYHHIALLLPDGKVFVAGGREPVGPCGLETPYPRDPRFSGEVFSPPYLDFGRTEMNRPVVGNLSSTAVSFGATFSLDATRNEDNDIDRVVLIRTGATTHHWDNDQKYIELSFGIIGTSPASPDETDTIEVLAPGDKVCAPGWYMLFVIESDGSGFEGHRVPSFGEFIRLK